jgi:serine-type D-Ala-D-Ala carboxypeptidase (penicillin-binding protein 5/6)
MRASGFASARLLIVRRLVAVVIAALAFATPARAGVPSVDARAFLVQDGRTGEVLAQRAAGTRVPIASLTKLMTVLLTLKSGVKLDSMVTVTSDAAAVGESSIGLRAGDRLTVSDLLKGALIQSANDAADALADYVSHDDEAAFVARMNAEARRLGLRGTHYARPDGLDAPGHVSTAHDVTVLAHRLMRYRVVRQIVRQRDATIAGGRQLHTWNDLLGIFRGVIGVKTGHTDNAGWCEVADVRRDGLDIYATILGSPTRGRRDSDLAALLRWALSVERPAWVIDPDRSYGYVSVGYGRAPVALVPARGVVRAVRVDRPLVTRVLAAAAPPLPVRRGERLGELRTYSGRKLVARQPLVAARSVRRPGAAARVGFYVRRTLSHIGSWFS